MSTDHTLILAWEVPIREGERHMLWALWWKSGDSSGVAQALYGDRDKELLGENLERWGVEHAFFPVEAPSGSFNPAQLTAIKSIVDQNVQRIKEHGIQIAEIVQRMENLIQTQ